MAPRTDCRRQPLGGLAAKLPEVLGVERGSPPLHSRKKFQNLLKNSALLDYFLALSHVFKYFCTEVYMILEYKCTKIWCLVPHARWSHKLMPKMCCYGERVICCWSPVDVSKLLLDLVQLAYVIIAQKGGQNLGPFGMKGCHSKNVNKSLNLWPHLGDVVP